MANAKEEGNMRKLRHISRVRVSARAVYKRYFVDPIKRFDFKINSFLDQANMKWQSKIDSLSAEPD